MFESMTDRAKRLAKLIAPVSRQPFLERYTDVIIVPAIVPVRTEDRGDLFDRHGVDGKTIAGADLVIGADGSILKDRYANISGPVRGLVDAALAAGATDLRTGVTGSNRRVAQSSKHPARPARCAGSPRPQ